MIFADLVSHSAWIQLGLSLAHFLWQGAAIAMLLAVVLFVMRRRAPEVRHGLCLGAMIAMGLCPLATLWYFHANPPTGIFADLSSSSTSTRVAVREPDAARIVNPPPEAVGQPVEQPAESSPLAALTEVEMPADDAPMAAPASAAPAAAPPSVIVRPHVPALAWGLTIAALVWAIGVAVLGVRFVFAWLGLRKLRGETEALPEAIERLAVRLRGVLGMRGDVPLRASQSVAEPLAFGLLRPIVLVPAALLTQCPVEMLEAIIAHELAHIRRHDLWINLLQRAIETLLFYHPAVWWVSGRMRLERELCCDDAAILATGKRADYANALVELSRSLHGWTAPALSAGMFTSRLSLPDRVRRVLQVPSAQHDPNRGRYWMTGPATLLLAGSLVLVSSLRPGVAQNAGPASDAAATQPSVSTPGQGAFNPKWQQLTDAAPQRRWSNVKIADALTDFSNLSGLNIVATQVIPSDLQKAINVDVSKARNFDEALTTLNTALFDANYWGVVNNGNLILRPLSEWYRNVPAEHMFMSENEYREAKLPEWDVAGVVFEPRSWPANVLANEATDLTPLNGARAMITPDGRRVRLIGFVRFINTQLAIMKKWDVPPAPSSDALARSRNLPAAGPRPTVAPATRPAGDPRLPVTTSDVFSPYTSRREELPASAVPVRPLADGVVTEVPVKLGQTVKKGDLLVRLDDAEPRLELEAAKARLQQVHGLYSRYKELVSQGAVTTEEKQKAETDVKLAELDVQKWELRIDRAQVRSPADGVVQVAQASGEADVRPAEAWIGKRVTAGETILYVDRGGSAPSSVTTRPAGQASPSAGVPSGFIPVSAFIPVRAPVAGVIQEVVAKPGQRVKKGDALAKLDARDAELELQAAKIRLDSTREIYDRATQLRKAGTVAEDEFLKAQTAAALAEVDLQRAQLQLERATIRSPIDGVFTDFDKSLLGQAVEVGRTLFSIAPMPEKQPANAGDTPVVPGLSPAR